MAQKFVAKTDRTQRQTDGIADVSQMRDRQFAASSAQVHQQGRRAIHPGTRDEAEMNQARFCYSGDDFDAPARRGMNPLEKRLRVARISQRTGGDDPDIIGDYLLRRAMESPEHLHGFGHRVRREKSRTEDPFAEPGHPRVLINSPKAPALQRGILNPKKIDPEIDPGKGSQGKPTVYMLE